MRTWPPAKTFSNIVPKQWKTAGSSLGMAHYCPEGYFMTRFKMEMPTGLIMVPLERAQHINIIAWKKYQSILWMYRAPLILSFAFTKTHI